MNKAKKFGSGLVVFLLASVSAGAAVIHESLQARLDRLTGGKTVEAIIFFNQQADIESLNRQLKTDRATLRERNHRVITALQRVATQAQPAATTCLQQLRGQGLVTDFRFYWIANAFYVEAYEAGIEALAVRPDLDILYANFPVELIEPVDSEDDGPLLLGHEIGLERINAPSAWEQGWTGAGRVVMNIDTGVDGNHPALASRFRGDINGDGQYDESWLDPYDTDWPFPQDGGSHGTHTMGTICGRTPAGDTIGVAIDAQWIAAAAVDRGGGIGRTIADIIVSFEWAVDPDGDPETQDNPDAIGNSWGIPDGYGYPDCDETFWRFIDNVEAVGSAVIFSAGNEGSNGLRSPADRAVTFYNVFSVGAVDGNNPNLPIAGFSARGPTECARGDLSIKPEVVAPGVSVRSSVPGGGYAYYSGTSMSSPHITGAVAVIRQVNPDLDVDTIKDILMSTAHDLPFSNPDGEDNIYGHGVIDLFDACLLAQADFGYVQGHVTDSEDVGIEGARIRVVGSERLTYTDQDGFYSLGLTGDTTYTFEASAFGYLPEEVEVDVAVQETTTVDFVLQLAQVGSLHGTVISAGDSSAIGQANVEIVDTGIDPVETDETGYYEFSEIPGGSTYTVHVRASGFGIGEDTVFVPAGGDAELNFALIQFESFENHNGGWLGEGLWEWGQPTSGPGSAYDGTNVWATVLGGDYENNVDDMLVSNFVHVDDPSAILSFHHWHSFHYNAGVAYDGGNVSVRVLGQEEWELIDPVGGYPYDQVQGLDNEPGYSDVSGGWQEAEFQIGAYENSTIQIGFRIGTGPTTTRAGWYIDAVVFSGVTTLPYPDIEIDPASFNIVLEQGQSTVRNLTISNPTDGILIFEIEPRIENRRLGGSTDIRLMPSIPVDQDPADRKYLQPETETEYHIITYGGSKAEYSDGEVNPPMISGRGGPDLFGYTWVDSDESDGPEFQWVDISRSGQPLFFNDDQNQGPFDLGFAMPFYGYYYSSINICSNGWISFTATETNYYNAPIPYAVEPNNLVAPFWDDLNPAQGGMMYFYTNGSDSAIVQWDRVPHDFSSGSYTFQVILDPQGNILFQYLAMVGELESNTVGIEDSDGSVGLQVAFGQSYVTDSLAVMISLPVFWLSADPLSGLIMQNGSMDVDVIFDAAELDEGVYAGYLNILSNDPVQPSLNVLCTLTVTGQTGTINDAGLIPTEFGLGQNYPNPFNPSTQIGFSLPTPSDVELVIYDLLGRQVRSLFSGNLDAGYHAVVWEGINDNGRAVPSGIYFYNLKAGKLQESRKMVMLK